MNGAPTFDGTRACRDADLELFFPAQGHHATAAVAEAKQICKRCPFRAPCLEYAVTGQGVPGVWLDGVWGGTTAAERRHIRRSRRQAAA